MVIRKIKGPVAVRSNEEFHMDFLLDDSKGQEGLGPHTLHISISLKVVTFLILFVTCLSMWLACLGVTLTQKNDFYLFHKKNNILGITVESIMNKSDNSKKF